MISVRIANDYFEWLCKKVCGKRFSRKTTYKKLLSFLHSIEFIYLIGLDDTRAKRGVDLRWVYSWETGEDYDEVMACLDTPCSVLEMMIALSISSEEIMDDPQIGDRTGQWFWNMVVNLGLGPMTDDRFDEEYAEKVILRFLNREYEPNGKGGLFTWKKQVFCNCRKYSCSHRICLCFLSFLYDERPYIHGSGELQHFTEQRVLFWNGYDGKRYFFNDFIRW